MTIETNEEVGPTQWCVVADRKTGHVVQIHQHVAGPGDKPLDERGLATSALNAGVTYDTEDLEVFHPSKGQSLEDGLFPTVIDGRIEMVEPNLEGAR